MIMELRGNYFFKEFGYEWEVWDWTVIWQGNGVKGGFFEKGFDESCFEGGWDIASFKGKIYDFGYEGTDGFVVILIMIYFWFQAKP